MKLAHISFFVLAFISLLVAIFFEKRALLYVQPLSVVAIIIIYILEKKEPTNIGYLASLVFSIFGGILLIYDFRSYVPEVSILYSLFYLLYIRLMYAKNEKKKTTLNMYLILITIFIPIVYIYDRVICLIYKEIKEDFAYFTVLILLILSFIVISLYYYLRNKNQSNLWMLIAAFNLGVMNIIIIINELYVYDTMFTVVALFCSHLMYYFSLKFMLEDDQTTAVNP